MSFLRKAFSGVSRLLGGGEQALRKIGDTARSIKSLGGKVNKATGGLAGTAWEASKLMPGIGTVTQGVQMGLDAADKYSAKGLAAIDIGRKVGKLL
jgi:hypothetical protein